MLGDSYFPKLSQKRNFLSQVFPNNGKISHLIPNWESWKVSCESELYFQKLI